MRSGLLLLADSRLPSGGHGHSGGVEALVDRGLLRSEADLAAFLAGRIATGAAVPAGAAAAACALAAGAGAGAGGSQRGHTPATESQQGHIPPMGVAAEWGAWDQAVSARLPAAATRAASYAQGAALLRTASRAWPSVALDALRALPRVHHPLVLGVAAAAAGATPSDAALLAVHHLVGGACTAAVRLLGLDPLTVAAVAAVAGRHAEPVAAEAARNGVAAAAAGDPALLPADGNPLYDVLAQLHRSTEATLFAS
jgi:urease accessory protein